MLTLPRSDGCNLKVVLLDAYNLIHRARSGFTRGDHAIVFNFFRGVRPIVEKLNPDKVYFVLEGYPAHRKEAFVEYKANRPKQSDSFNRQKKEIIELVKEAMPFDIMRHPDLECDDLIANLANYHSSLGDECVIVSGDSDFIQIFDSCENVEIYHPIKKSFVENPDYDYLSWKALRGDSSDNIPGIKGVGDKTATKLVTDNKLLSDFLSKKENKEIYERNLQLISFTWLSDFSPGDYTVSCGQMKPDILLNKFSDMGFSSMIKENTWKKYKETFNSMQ